MNLETIPVPAVISDEAARAHLVRRATAALEAAAGKATRTLDRHAAEFGLSDAKLEMLEVLCSCRERRTCLYELGEQLGVTRPNITKLVDGLERGGLVERTPHPSDRRMVQACLTEAGDDVAARALPGRSQRLEALFSRLEDGELVALVALLELVGGPSDRPMDDEQSIQCGPPGGSPA
jgi:DNA-binding MarR family transcriptional regulator